MSCKKEKSVFSMFVILIAINGILIVPIIYCGVYCVIQFTEMWTARHNFTVSKVLNRKIKEEQAWEQKTFENEEKEVDSDTAYQSVDFRVPAELMKKAKETFEKDSRPEKMILSKSDREDGE